MFLIVLISLIIYIVAGVMIYHSTYNLDKEKMIKFFVITAILAIIITTIIANISSSKIKTDMKEQLNTAKTVIILIFSPINLIVTAPYIGHLLNQYEANKEINNINRKLVIFIIVLILVMIFEANYMDSFQAGMLQKLIK